ncbi:STAS domain-containing protein [Nonomuraea sp. NPDC049152]|uniref:STAS domain-containing protein n=1 Tax=Nonomuraea sp. NPDC049152 TaxID=3154350 RepID=UPI0033FA1394
MAELNVEVERSSGAAVVRLEGDLDKLTASILDERLSQLLAEGVLTFVVDASALAFCDSSGLWVLIEHLRHVRERGGSLRLTGVHGVLRRVLEVTGLNAAFP